MKIVVTIISVATLLAVGCVSRNEHAETRSEGERLFRASCRTCHRLPNPKSKTDVEWPQFVQRYGERAKLDSDQMALITAHLQGNN